MGGIVYQFFNFLNAVTLNIVLHVVKFIFIATTELYFWIIM